MKILEALNITKSFPGVVALDAVDVAFEAGKIHGIVGENGAGKSTLVKILTGVYRPDKGKVFVQGTPAHERLFLFEKVAYVPQELDLFWNMTVAENLFIPFRRSGFKGVIVKKRRLMKAATSWLDRFGITVDPAALVKDISVSDQQLLQIARACVNKYFEILILDEPTTSLTLKDTAHLFEVLRQLKAEGKAIIFISHKLDELFEICDEVTLLRNGVKVGASSIEEIDRRWVINTMSGRNIDEDNLFRPSVKSDQVVLVATGLTGRGFADISFTLRRGEILGFSGLVGSGRSEIMQTLFGFLPAKAGKVELGGRPWKLGDTNFSIRNGLFYLPEERKQQGIFPLLSVQHNIGISLIKQTLRWPAISAKKERVLVNGIVQSYAIKTPSLDREIMYLSGGNQQKAVIGRAMACMPKVLIFDEPTKGIDVGTKADLYRLMKQLAEEREISIILISSELEELLRCSNRIITIYNGRKVGEFETDQTGKSEILASIIGGNIESRERLL